MIHLIKNCLKGNDYILCALPVEELNILHSNEYERNVLPIGTSVASPAYHIKAQFAVNATSGTLTLNCGAMQFVYNVATQKLTILGYKNIEIALAPVDNKIDFELLSDIGFMEIFLNGGETVGTFYQPYDNLSNTNININSSNTNISVNSFKLWRMQNIH
jgi:sucrose-6-phosphate hydrolase SacC (GH32 family)